MQKINRLQSFQVAFIGIWHTLTTQRNAQIHVVIALLITFLGLLLKISTIEWAIIALTIGFVIAVEMLNTAAEAAMDYATTEYHPQVKIVKDVAAGAVLTAALSAVAVGCFIFGPPLLALAASQF